MTPTLLNVADSAPARSLVNSGFHLHARLRLDGLRHSDAVLEQRRTLRRLVRTARNTRFGRDHRFGSIGSVRDFQDAVPIRTYEDFWRDYLQNAYPICEDLTWPGRIPYFALTSGTTQGQTKYIPVSRAMIASNRRAAQTMLAHHLASFPDSRLFHGRIFFLGGSTRLEDVGGGVRQGDLSGIAATELAPSLRPYTFPPLDLALEEDWDLKLTRLAERSLGERITLVSGVPSWLLALFERVLELSGRSRLADVWPDLEQIVHGGVKFDPYRRAFRELTRGSRVRLQETYPCSEGFVAYGDPVTDQLRLVSDHGLFYEFIPVEELGASKPTRHWLGTAEPGVNYAIVVSTCAGLWGHLVGDTIRFESVRPPLLRFTGRTKYTLSAFGEHLISEEVEAAIEQAAGEAGVSVRDWHVGPVFEGSSGHHRFVVEFLGDAPDLTRFRLRLDEELGRRNADYRAHRIDGVGLPPPELIVSRSGGFAGWMRSRGKLGGQNKVPRMDDSGRLTAGLLQFLREEGHVAGELPAG